MERELQKIKLKNEFRGVKVGGPLFIDTMDKQWPSDENNLDVQDCPMW